MINSNILKSKAKIFKFYDDYKSKSLTIENFKISLKDLDIISFDNSFGSGAFGEIILSSIDFFKEAIKNEDVLFYLSSESTKGKYAIQKGNNLWNIWSKCSLEIKLYILKEKLDLFLNIKNIDENIFYGILDVNIKESSCILNSFYQTNLFNEILKSNDNEFFLLRLSDRLYNKIILNLKNSTPEDFKDGNLNISEIKKALEKLNLLHLKLKEIVREDKEKPNQYLHSLYNIEKNIIILSLESLGKNEINLFNFIKKNIAFLFSSNELLPKIDKNLSHIGLGNNIVPYIKPIELIEYNKYEKNVVVNKKLTEEIYHECYKKNKNFPWIVCGLFNKHVSSDSFDMMLESYSEFKKENNDDFVCVNFESYAVFKSPDHLDKELEIAKKALYIKDEDGNLSLNSEKERTNVKARLDIVYKEKKNQIYNTLKFIPMPKELWAAIFEEPYPENITPPDQNLNFKTALKKVKSQKRFTLNVSVNFNLLELAMVSKLSSVDKIKKLGELYGKGSLSKAYNKIKNAYPNFYLEKEFIAVIEKDALLDVINLPLDKKTSKVRI